MRWATTDIIREDKMKLYAVAILDKVTGEMANEIKLVSHDRALTLVQMYKNDKHYKYVMLAIDAEVVA